MKLNLTQQNLKQIVSDHFNDVKDVQFNTGTKMSGDSQRERQEVGVFEGCTITFNGNDPASAFLNDIDMIMLVKDYVRNQGFSVESDSDIVFRMSTRTTGSGQRDFKTVPVFNGISVECQELDNDMSADVADKNNSQKWGETITFVSDLRKNEHAESLHQMTDRDLCEMIRAHFVSHPTLPGEKHLKDSVNAILNEHPDGEIKLDDEVKFSFVEEYVDTRIRQTSVNMSGVHPEDLKLDTVNPADYAGKCPVQNIITDGKVTVSFGKVELQRSSSEDVYVLAERNDGTYQTIGSLPNKFLKNNHMNVEFCEADLQLVDYSNGKMKNVSAKVVVDTDLMSGDVIDLNEDMLSGLDQTSGLEQ